jgi:hypothetical protein
MIEKRSIVVDKGQGVKLTRNVYVDKKREYSKKSGDKKMTILNEYSEAKQRNILMEALVSIAESNNINTPEVVKLKELKSFIDSI